MNIKRYLLASALVGSVAGVAYAASNIDVGTTGSSQGTVTLHGGTSGSAVIGTPAAAGTGTTFTLPNTNGSAAQLLTTDGSGNLSWTGPLNKHETLSWAPGQNLSGVSIPIFHLTASSTVNSAFCRVETQVGGTATVKMFFAPSGTACASGTAIVSAAPCNAQGTAATDQTLTVDNTALTAPGDICVNFPTNAAWSTSAGSGNIQVNFSTP